MRETERQGEYEKREGKERAKRDRNSYIFGVVRKYLMGKESGKKGVIKIQNPYFISINRLIRKYILSFHP